MLDFMALAQQCAPTVAPQTMAAVVQVESSFNPYAIGVVGGRLQRQPNTKKPSSRARTSASARRFSKTATRGPCPAPRATGNGRCTRPSPATTRATSRAASGLTRPASRRMCKRSWRKPTSRRSRSRSFRRSRRAQRARSA
ncbi:TPA: transglycosylase SLT domain-containing protein [Pseudomonas aeruginosa]|nr:transglycosylase SLT domain-containing protein [Pseudomonas aeruginosa]HBN8980233.1 transglycosylase SLT domain-containing protein [Pseudomonas aeruginosa]